MQNLEAAITCTTCGVPFNRTESEIRNRNMRCYPCRSAWLRDYRKTRVGRESEQRAKKVWRSSNRRRVNERTMKWDADNREKKLAHRLVSDTVRRGKMFRPDHCTKCGLVCKPEGHHEDYSKPLEVIWVCLQCHSNIHRKKVA